MQPILKREAVALALSALCLLACGKTPNANDDDTVISAGSGGTATGSSGSGGSAAPNTSNAQGGSGGAVSTGSGGVAGTLDAGHTPVALDAALPADAAAATDADTAAPDAGVRMPVFQQTDCIDPSTIVADVEKDFPCNGIDLWVVVPKRCLTRACGVIFNIHGGGMPDHTTLEQATDMIAVGSAHDFIVVHPHKGASGTWDVGNDKNVVFAGMQEVITAFDVDRARVHSTGYSQGGRISWALGCEHADVVASIAPAEENNTHSDCWKTAKLPVRTLSVLFQFGKRDAIGGGYASAMTTAEQFVSAHAMTGPETIAGMDGTRMHRQRWTAADGNVLEFISHDYSNGLLAGHCLALTGGDTFVSCDAPVDYEWGQEVVSFFQAHPMP